jgi:hypothetical protein
VKRALLCSAGRDVGDVLGAGVPFHVRQRAAIWPSPAADLAAPGPGPPATAADGLGDVIAALRAAGALSPLSPVPGQLAALCARLHLTGHGITAPPARNLPGPWLSMLITSVLLLARPATSC